MFRALGSGLVVEVIVSLPQSSSDHKPVRLAITYREVVNMLGEAIRG